MINKTKEELLQIVLRNTFNMAKAEAEKIRRDKRNLYIFCAGSAGRSAKENLANMGINTYRFIDNNKEKIGKTVDDIPVISLSDAKNDPQKTIIIATLLYYDDILSQCLENGITLDEICFADFQYYDGSDETLRFFCENSGAIYEIFEKCIDDESREAFIVNLLYKLSYNRQDYKCPKSDFSKRYFDRELMHLSETEVFLDCGAHDGDTVIEFCERVNGKFKKVIAFEPDNENFKYLTANTALYNNVICVNAGVGEEKKSVSFSAGKGRQCFFSEVGDVVAQVTTIDSFTDEKPTFIKMDIEGYELSALKGAKEVISEQKPKLAICLYHKPCDIVELPQYISELRPDYKFYFRMYKNFGHDLILYAV
jgi:FkbM family methyltransferase